MREEEEEEEEEEETHVTCMALVCPQTWQEEPNSIGCWKKRQLHRCKAGSYLKTAKEKEK